MDLYRRDFKDWDWYDEGISPPRKQLNFLPLLVQIILALLVGYYAVQRTDYFPLLPLQELLWNALVYIMPPSLVMALDKEEGTEGSEQNKFLRYSDSRTFAAKSEAMRRILRIGGPATALSALTRPRALSGMSSLLKSQAPFSLPGLGNWDNSCYQNSVIQGLASLPPIPSFLDRLRTSDVFAWTDSSTGAALDGIIGQLNDRENGGRRLWTPAGLKSMSSWQQQDAQEYYSKILDDIEKEAISGSRNPPKHDGFRIVKAEETLVGDRTRETGGSDAEAPENEVVGSESSNTIRNPLEGLQAQRVGCLQCGYVEGLSIVPFNCITLPLARTFNNSVEDCLDDFTELETIEGVECGRCTLLRQEQNLQSLLTKEEKSVPGSLSSQVEQRLALVRQALLDGDFSEATIAKKCQVSDKQRVTSTKTKQTVIARQPESLVLHFNRSVFDEMTGALSKNTSRVAFPETLDLGSWSLGGGDDGFERWNVDPHTSLLANAGSPIDMTADSSRGYALRAVITHYGRHENGHYVCYRRDPEDAEQWWQLNDDEVSPANVGEVLSQGGVFMLFYSRISGDEPSHQRTAFRGTEQHSAEVENFHEAEEMMVQATDGSRPVDVPFADDSSNTHDVNREYPHGSADVPAVAAVMSSIEGAVTQHHEEGSSDKLTRSTTGRGEPLRPEDGRQSETVPALLTMRTAASKKSRARKGNRPGMSSMSNMVAAN